MKEAMEGGCGGAKRRWAHHLSRWRWLIGLSLAAAIGATASWLASAIESRESIAAIHAPLTSPLPSNVKDLAWQSLTADQKRILEPLRGTWPSMDEQEQAVWLRVAKHMQHKPPRLQQRLQKRMKKWSEMTPRERARARLNFMQIARRYDVKQRESQWSHYQSPQSKLVSRPVRAEPALRVEAPALVQVLPGVTTVLVSRLNDVAAAETQAAIPASSPPAVPALVHAPDRSGPSTP